MTTTRWSLLGALLLSGCTDGVDAADKDTEADTDTDTDTDADSDTDTDTDTDADPQTADVSGIVATVGGDPVEGVAVGLGTKVGTILTDAAGAFTLTEVPVGEREISFQHDDYVPVLLAADVPPGGFDDLDMLLSTETEISFLGLFVSVDIDPKLSLLGFAAVDSEDAGVGGVAATLDVPSGDGPFYQNNLDLPDVSLVETDAGGGGAGSFVNLPDGTYTLTLAGDGLTCAAGDLGWDRGGGALEVPLVPGWFTITAAVCE